MLLDIIFENTEKYISLVPKENRKEIAQFFTEKETARYMASLFSNLNLVDKIHILDPGTGTGILTAALLERICANEKIKSIYITFYENDSKVINLLKENINLMVSYCNSKKIKLNFQLIEDNFIIKNEDKWNKNIAEFDIVICNPPYKKIQKNSQEACVMSSIVYGQPNLYALFLAMSVNVTKEEGELCFIIPRSWTTGLYFYKLREFLFTHFTVRNVHLFISRNDLFSNDKILQETIILHGKKIKSRATDIISISSSNNSKTFEESNILRINYNSCIQNFNGRYMFLPMNNEDVQLLNRLNSFSNTLLTLGYKLKTGRVVEFRSKNQIKKKKQANTIPLLWAYHFREGRIKFPVNNEKQYFKDVEGNVGIANNNYLLIKRFTTKDDHKRLQPAIYLGKDTIDCDTITMENHVNYLCKNEGFLTQQEVYGFYAIFNSSLWDHYYRIQNGNTQVNSNEINSMPLPAIKDIIKLGDALILAHDLSTVTCDRLIEEVLFRED